MKQTIWAIIILILFLSCKNKPNTSNEQIPELMNNELPITLSTQLGIDSLVLSSLTTKIEKQEYPNIHSLLIMKNGLLIYENYFKGYDENYGNAIGLVQHSDTTLHDVRSISKSVVSICMGIAINQGLIKGVNQNISQFFPNIEFKGDKSKWTIHHFLTMTTGLVWDKNSPYNNPENDEIKMTDSHDALDYVLNKPLKTAPGKKFNYNGGATQVLAKIIERASNMTLYQFVKEYLFLPLEINHFEWNKYSVWNGSDEFAAPSGLRLTSRDLLKIGLLFRNKGVWKNKQIIPKEWVIEAISPKIDFPSEVTDGNEWYGYQFWIWPDIFNDSEFNMVAAIGNGGQNIFWDLKNDLIVVTTAGNYNNRSIKNDPYALLKNEVYPIVFYK